MQQMRGERMPERMATGGFVDARAADRFFGGVLQILFDDVMPLDRPRARINGMFRCGKNVLPDPRFLGIGVFAFQREGEMNPSKPECQVLLGAAPGLLPSAFSMAPRAAAAAA